ncbi:TPA: transposase [Pseudomonas putida]|nr:transposase [Pseudomonas putida]
MLVDVVKGLQVIAKGKVAIVTRAVDAECVEVFIVSTSKTETVSLQDVEFLRPANRANIVPANLLSAQEISADEMQEANRRFDVLSRLQIGSLSVAEASVELEVAPSHLYKLLQQYDKDVGPIGLVRKTRGPKKGLSRFPAEVEELINLSIKKFKNHEAINFSTVWDDVQVSCMEKGVQPPSQRTISRRIRSVLSARKITQLKEGKAVAAQKHDARPGKLLGGKPLELVQMDHTLVDVILLANNRRDVIGRPWLTVVLDVNTRVLLGYYLSLHAPSAISIASAMAHAVLMKHDFLERLDLENYSYPFFGLPQMVYMDNAGEFTSPKFLAALDRALIAYEHRPPGKKHFGGHVERYIGTMMHETHLLSGTTMSDPRARKDLSRCAEPTMTFKEYSRWFCLQVIKYHNTVHSGLGMSPTEAWQNYYGSAGIAPYPPIVTDPHQFRLGFMPSDTRNVRPCGIEFKGKVYWDPLLEPYVGTKKAIFKYDPFSLSQIWLRVDGSYMPVPFSDLSESELTLEEYRAGLYFSGRGIPGTFTDPVVVESYRESEEVVKESKKLTARAKACQEEYDLAQPLSTKIPDAKNIDYSQPPALFKSERPK